MVGVVAEHLHGNSQNNVEHMALAVTRIQESFHFVGRSLPKVFHQILRECEQRCQSCISNGLAGPDGSKDFIGHARNLVGNHAVCGSAVFAPVGLADRQKHHLLFAGREARGLAEQALAIKVRAQNARYVDHVGVHVRDEAHLLLGGLEKLFLRVSGTVKADG